MLDGAVASDEPDEPTPLEREILTLADSMERIHPDLFHAVSRTRFRKEAESLASRSPDLTHEQLVVGLMRLVALAGERDGHTAISPFDIAHARRLNVYPLRLYDFADGLHVVGSIGGEDLTGRKLTAISGTPIAEVVERVKPLVPRDNDSGLRWLLPEFVTAAEVLRGLGIVTGATAVFRFADASEVSLDPVAAAEVSRTLGSARAPLPTSHDPLWLRRPDETQWLITIRNGSAVYLGYRRTTEPTDDVAQRLLALAQQPKVRRVIVDVRLNHGGDNRTYRPLLEVLSRPAIGGKTIVLLGRGTFSAAGNFVADVDRYTKARLVGEPSGGAPSQWGDSEAVALARAGLTVRVATMYWEFGPQGDKRLATEPDVAVETTAADFFTGRDPVLARALALR